MYLQNINIVRPDITILASDIDKTKLETFYKEISVLTDLSDKSFEKEISSPYIGLITSTFFYDYFIDKYKVDKSSWLEFILSINTLV